MEESCPSDENGDWRPKSRKNSLPTFDVGIIVVGLNIILDTSTSEVLKDGNEGYKMSYRKLAEPNWAVAADRYYFIYVKLIVKIGVPSFFIAPSPNLNRFTCVSLLYIFCISIHTSRDLFA